MTTLEIAVTSVEDAANAAAGGADSVELSYDLAVGGLTPDTAVMQAVRDVLQIPLYVILRPHADSFRYTESQIEEMLDTVHTMQQTGVDGVVFGAVDPANRIDVALMRQVVAAASPLPVTLHRALDMSTEPEAALEALQGIVPRVLTSGPAVSAWEGRDGLRRWITRFGDRFTFVSSGSLSAEQLAAYISWVQPDTVHLGSAARSSGGVDREKVQRLKAMIDMLNST